MEIKVGYFLLSHSPVHWDDYTRLHASLHVCTVFTAAVCTCAIYMYCVRIMYYIYLYRGGTTSPVRSGFNLHGHGHVHFYGTLKKLELPILKIIQKCQGYTCNW